METLLMKANEVAQALGLGRSKTYELISRNQLPVVRVGRSVRVPRAALEQWVRQQTLAAVDQ